MTRGTTAASGHRRDAGEALQGRSDNADEAWSPGGCTTLATYRDPVEGFAGYVAFDGQDNPLAAGGFRVQRGLTANTIVRLAQAMSRKQRLLALAVDGAKCGIDYDPQAPGKHEAMRRFLRFLRPWLLDRFSMGPDMGTTWSEIEALARQEGIPSVKIAVANAQGLEHEEVLRRLLLLDERVDGLTLAQRRAGHGLAAAALGAITWLQRDPATVRVGVQGFGTLARGAVLSLAQAGCQVTAVADEHGCRLAPEGLDVGDLLDRPAGAPVAPGPRTGQRAAGREALFGAPVDLLVLAACEDAMSAEQASRLPRRVKAVAVGANLGLAAPVEHLLGRRGVVVVPDFVAGCGGSASMDALFGPPVCPTPTEFLERLDARLRGAVRRMLDLASARGCSPRAAALALCEEQRRRTHRKPYGP